MNESNQKQKLGNPFSLYWQGQIQDDLEEIKELNKENKDFQFLREQNHDDKEAVMMIREILFINARCIQRLKERIEDAKSTIKKLS